MVTDVRDAVKLNLAQCFNAHENLYFAWEARVGETLASFKRRRQVLGPGAASVTELPAFTPDGRKGVMLAMLAPDRRMPLPHAVQIRRAAHTGRHALGDSFIRDPIRTAVVKAEFDRIQKLREQATAAAESKKASALD